MANILKYKLNVTSKYKGVYFQKESGKWRAGISYRNKTIYIGLYLTEDEAALAYNAKAIELFGEFAVLNKVS
jgi:hypothetical protein